MNKKVLTLLGSVTPGKFGDGGFMYRQVIPFLVITLLLLALGTPSTVLAGPPIQETGNLTNNIGTVSLFLNNGQLTAKISAENLTPGDVYSVWGKIDSASSFNLSGGIARRDGTRNFTGHAATPSSGFSFEVTIKHHGEPIPGLVDDQKSTKTAGCGAPPLNDDCEGTVGSVTINFP